MGLIDANELRKYVWSISTSYLNEWDTAGVLMAIERQKTLDVEPVRHGRWEEYPDKVHLRCTACKVEFLRQRMPETRKRCPNCGAKMDAKDE